MRGSCVSVVIAVHNGERYLAAAVESALRQRPAPAELIVVDDGSTDLSLPIARRFGSPVRCVSQECSGVGAARNKGVTTCRGDFVAFLDSDDLWTSNKLACQLAAFAADSKLEVVFGLVRQFISPDVDQETAVWLDCRTELAPGYLPGAAIVRRGVFERVGLFREDLVSGEFIDWMARARELSLHETVLDDHVLWRRIHSSNHGLVRADARKDYARVLKWALDRRRAGSAPVRPATFPPDSPDTTR